MRKDVREAQHVHGVDYRSRNRIALAGDQGGRDRAGIALEHAADTAVDPVTQTLDGRSVAKPGAGWLRCRRELDRPERKSGRPDLLEVEVAAEIVAAGP